MKDRLDLKQKRKEIQSQETEQMSRVLDLIWSTGQKLDSPYLIQRLAC